MGRKAVKEEYMGPPPKWDSSLLEDDAKYRVELAYALNYYNLDMSPEKRKSTYLLWVKDNVSPDTSRLITGIPMSVIPNYIGTYAHLINDGTPLSATELDRLKDFTDTYVKTLEETKKAKKAEKQEKDQSPAPLYSAKVSTAIFTIEEKIVDAFMVNGKVDKEFNLMEYLQGIEFPVTSLGDLESYFKEEHDFLLSADKEIKDSLVQPYDKTIKMFDKLFVSIAGFRELKKQTRKSRKTKKTKLTSKINLSNFKFKTVDNELQIASVNPTKIIGASQAWIWDGSKRKLIKLVAESGGFTVKGTTIGGVDETQSSQKNIRDNKVSVILTDLMTKTKPGVSKLYNSIRAKEAKTTGRTNDETLILKVFI